MGDEIITNIIEIVKMAENGISSPLTHLQNELKITLVFWDIWLIFEKHGTTTVWNM